MSHNLDRRNFLKKSIVASASAAAGLSIEKKILADEQNTPPVQPAQNKADQMPTGKIKHLKIGRLISGGNLISGYTHSRDLRYVKELANRYNTDPWA